jgi:hypothetical protein
MRPVPIPPASPRVAVVSVGDPSLCRLKHFNAHIGGNVPLERGNPVRRPPGSSQPQSARCLSPSWHNQHLTGTFANVHPSQHGCQPYLVWQKTFGVT